MRNQLAAAVRTATHELGYNFFEGFEYRINEKNLHFPVAWMIPPNMLRVNGRQEGEVTYRVTLHLMKVNRKWDEEAKNNEWDGMEREIVRIVNRMMQQPGVFCAENISLAPAEFSLTKQGEISVTAEFDVRMYFDKSPYENN